MTNSTMRILLSVAFAGATVLTGISGAQANDDRWDRDHWAHEKWERDHRHHGPEHHVHVVHERYVEAPPRVVYQRPVVVAPMPVYQAPMYSQPVDPSLNFNFTIPLR